MRHQQKQQRRTVRIARSVRPHLAIGYMATEVQDTRQGSSCCDVSDSKCETTCDRTPVHSRPPSLASARTVSTSPGGFLSFLSDRGTGRPRIEPCLPRAARTCGVRKSSRRVGSRCRCGGSGFLNALSRRRGEERGLLFCRRVHIGELSRTNYPGRTSGGLPSRLSSLHPMHVRLARMRRIVLYGSEPWLSPGGS